MKYTLITLLFLAYTIAGNAQKTFPVWPGNAPGSESWQWHEQEDTIELPGDPLTYNITQPTITFYPADPSVATGVSVIVCPGGSFCYLHIKTEGTDVAHWLNKKGVSVFVLKYRVIHSETSYPRKEKNERIKDTANSAKLSRQVIPLAIADGKEAIAYVRKHAGVFNIDPHKIGILGFSAGGTLAAASAFDYTADNRPDFVAPIYAYIPPALPMTVLKDAPPLFIAAATDDELHLVPMSINLYTKWLTAGHSAEIHIYSKGGHGFGMNQQHQPSDTWIDRLGDWLQLLYQQADLVLLNGKIITLKEAGNTAEAVAIKADKIIAVGSNELIKTFITNNTKVIDLHGRTVVPGFNDVHQHPAPVYSWEKPYAILRLDTVSSMSSLINLLKRKAAITPKGMLIRGVAYNEIKLGGQPIRDSLDKASTDHPILITHASGHVSAANSYLLEASGINSDTNDPAGGALERYKNGEPDGIIKESARQLLSFTKITSPPTPTPQEELEGYKIYFHNMLAGGLTSIADCWTTPDKVKMYKTLVADHFPLRFNLYIGVDYLDQLLSGQIQREASDYLRIGGVKIVQGNSLSGKTCWLNEPYDTINPATGKKDYYGIPPARSQQALDSLVLKIHSAGLQIACHSNGDREIDMIIAAIEKAQQTDYRPDVRHRIEHCSVTNQGIMDKLKRDSIIPVFHCYINELGGQLQVYGTKRFSLLMPTKTALDMGIPFALHSDYPISRYEAMIRIGSAVNRTTKDGIVLGSDQRIGVEDAIRAYTVGGAYTTHEENKKGKIVSGQLADLVVLSQDPTTINPAQIENIQVLTTIVGGQIAFQKD